MLKLRLIRINDYAVLEGGQRIGPNPLRQLPGVWLWNVTFRNINPLASAV